VDFRFSQENSESNLFKKLGIYVLGYGLDVGAVMFRVRAGAPEFIPSLKHPDSLEDHPLNLLFIGCGGSSLPRQSS
jgi:hypothetical protein